MKDDELIEPCFYSVLKECGYPTERFASGKYKDHRAYALWIAYLCGKEQEHAQHIMERYPGDEEQPCES